MMHKAIAPLSLDELRAGIGQRRLFVWGAGNQGRGITRVLLEHGIVPSGYIDRSPDLIGTKVAGIPVLTPEILATVPRETIFIIIAVFFHEQEISTICQEHDLKPGREYIHYSSLKPRDYSVDVAGSCNLRCISCPRASGTKGPGSGLMTLADFCKVIDKIRREDPFVGNIQLYQWAEPTLNKNLPEMISYAREKGIYSAISSNLNRNVDYRDIVAARPEWFRISASGWGDQYEITHTGGCWDIFLNNLKQVALLRQQMYPEMKLELYYHLYRHSIGKGLLRFRDLCKELGIEFHPVYAYLISLDDVLRYQEGAPLPEAARQAQERMLLDLDEGLGIARREAALACDAFRSIHINADLSVSNCMMYFYPEENRAVANFLEHGVVEIMELRRRCALCKRCMRHGMHRYCGAYSTFKPNIDALSHDG